MPVMAKKKKSGLYVDIDSTVRRRLNRLAAARMRKLNAEVQLALIAWLDREEKKEGLDREPLPEDEDE